MNPYLVYLLRVRKNGVDFHIQSIKNFWWKKRFVFCFLVVSHASAFARMSDRKKQNRTQCCESIHSSIHFKILQLVRAKNRPIPQPFVQFLVESNSHQYESKEWHPGL